MFRLGVYACVFIFMVCGLFGVVWGAYTQIAYFNGLNALVGEFLFFLAPCFFIASGIFELTAAWVSFQDLKHNDRFEIIAIRHLLLVVMITEVCYLIGVYRVGVELDRELPNALNSTLRYYKATDGSTSAAWDLLQNKYNCCGVTSRSDWELCTECLTSLCNSSANLGCLTPLKNSVHSEVLGVAILATVKGLTLLATIGCLALNYPGYGIFHL